MECPHCGKELDGGNPDYPIEQHDSLEPCVEYLRERLSDLEGSIDEKITDAINRHEEGHASPKDPFDWR